MSARFATKSVDPTKNSPRGCTLTTTAHSESAISLRGLWAVTNTLCTERPGAKSVQSVNGCISTYCFKPMDKRVPLIMIKPEDLPSELITDLSSY
ncbi:hypothetical protein DM01DRAFT_1409535 [Hesseltinella vesiculosa]|uniref:CSD2 domain-containing protein n=1 Tax=Hesseltinella vesiculosa TaxID=101127 RepID=A0A1X2GAA8_9FUNG|nr:hypothetical protein DM01DRAFT_1409535 [Hesseltinella vesiculosa]